MEGGGVTCKYAASGNIDNAEYFCIIYVPALSSSCREPGETRALSNFRTLALRIESADDYK